ncbi:MAG: type I DNA topoisomerase [Dehalococcoidales bacterium]|nr:type I DNA topoisomerase [Dehalococcoidales bacterium]
MTTKKKTTGKNLVIVESPAKAKTLERILGKKYELKASLGHVRDLPRSKLGVDVENSFNPQYVVPRTKSKLAKELRDACKNASKVFLATDPDREGEAISWHLLEVMKVENIPYSRVVFHEITEEAIMNAFKHPRDIDMQLVNAQQARRVLDRLVGYKLSPLLWRKIRRGLSAGRVQSVAVKIIVDREREIENFKPVEYWTIEAELSTAEKAKKNNTFKASLVGLAGEKKVVISNNEEASVINDELKKAVYSVDKVKTKKVNRQPAPPFITSTLQQEASRRLRFSAAQTMALAQQLYEGLPIGSEGSAGLITYMRTDSTRIARSAVAEAREYIEKKYGEDYLPPHARSFSRTVKGAQEAHEAIRPTRIMREPAAIKQFLNNNQYKLYELIWKRTVASQMAAAVNDNTTVDIDALNKTVKKHYLLRVSDSVNVFPGFTVLYIEQKDEEEEEKLTSLPPMKSGDNLDLINLFPEQHFTQPPSRFTEATLIKILEQNGIGRPSTYAPTLSTIQEREYVKKTGNFFIPTELGILVNDMVSEHFPEIVDIQFTAKMEDELDDIADDKRDWVKVIEEFYTPFAKSLEKAAETMEKVKLPDEETSEICPKCGKPMVVKTGRFGKFLACSGYPDCKTTKSYQVKTGVECPECGSEIIEKVNKKKKKFYGCSNYPKCTFATNFKPLPQKCSKCGGLMTVYRQKLARCIKCGNRDKLQE